MIVWYCIHITLFPERSSFKIGGEVSQNFIEAGYGTSVFSVMLNNIHSYQSKHKPSIAQFYLWIFSQFGHAFLF